MGGDRPATLAERNALIEFAREQKLSEAYVLQALSIAAYDPHSAERYLNYVVEQKRVLALARTKFRKPWHQFSKKVW